MLRRASLLALLVAGASAAPASAVTISSPRAPEGGSAVFSVTNDQLTPITVSTADGSAKAGSDYTAQQNTVVQPGTHDVPVATTQDSSPELDETFQLVYSGLGTPVKGTATIADDDPPALSVGDGAALESGGGAVDVPITSSVAVSRPISVDVTTADGTATAPGDYTATSTRVTLPAGATSTSVRIPIADDGLDEDPETFAVNLAAVGGTATLARAQGTVTITSDNDYRMLTIADAQTTESDGANGVVRIPVTLSAPTFRTVSVQFATLDLTAKAPRDYLARVGSLTIAPGQTQGFIDIATVSDDVVEKSEQFVVLLGKQLGAGIARGGALVTIADDDAAAGDDVPPAMKVAGLARSGSRAVKVRVTCPKTETRCTGRAAFYSEPDRRAKARALRGERRLGRRSFTLAGGKSTTLKLTIPRAVASAAKQAGRLKVRAFVVTDDANDNTDTTTASRTIRFRR